MSATAYTDTQSLLKQLPPGIAKVGLDLEADSLYRHRERICLVQVCFEEEVELLDPLSDDPIEPLVKWLGDAVVWMHGADYDMSLMIREWETLPNELYDTQIAAQLIGHTRFGYAGLVEEYFDVALSKSSQKADWGKRPLSPRMLEYARNDVKYLLPLADALREKLEDLERWDWFLESCQHSMQKVVKRQSEERELWRINGAGRLQRNGLNYLKYLWEWRDGEASRWNRPSFMVANNRDLLAWSQSLAEGKKFKIPEKLRNDRRKRLLVAIDEAIAVPEDQWPTRPKRKRAKPDPNFETKVKEQLQRRNLIAEELGLDPSLIASRALVEQIVAGHLAPEEILMNWQRKLLEI